MTVDERGLALLWDGVSFRVVCSNKPKYLMVGSFFFFLPWREMVINNTIVELYYLIVQLHYLIIIIINSLMERKSESDLRSILRMTSNDPLHGGLCTYLLWDIFLLQKFLVCVSIIDFWFVVILKFWYQSLYIYEIILSSCSLNCKFISSVLHLYPPLLMISDFGGIIVHGWFCIFTVYISLLVSLFICGTLFLVTYFSFLRREVPLGFVVRLV